MTPESKPAQKKQVRLIENNVRSLRRLATIAAMEVADRYPRELGQEMTRRLVRTGTGTRHLTGPPQSGNHPLRAGDSGLLGASFENSQNLNWKYPSKNKRPGMGGALLVGDITFEHSSMKSGKPNLHPLVEKLLDEIPEKKRSKGHGHCAEVGAISDYLLDHKPVRGRVWTIELARSHFESTGAATAAHNPDGGKATDACSSCQYLTERLCIKWLTREIWESVDRRHDYIDPSAQAPPE